MKTILFDVDGVLADFVEGFTTLAGLIDGTRRHWTQLEHGAGAAWSFKDSFEPVVINTTWDTINESKTFWTALSPLVSPEVWEQIEELHIDNHVVFGTNRGSTPNAQRQTQEWLAAHGVHGANVVLSDKKGDLARAIKADYAIDDKPENAACLHWIADVKPCRVYFKLWPCTQEKAVFLPENIRRVETVAEFLDDVNAGR